MLGDQEVGDVRHPVKEDARHPVKEDARHQVKEDARHQVKEDARHQVGAGGRLEEVLLRDRVEAVDRRIHGWAGGCLRSPRTLLERVSRRLTPNRVSHRVIAHHRWLTSIPNSAQTGPVVSS